MGAATAGLGTAAAGPEDSHATHFDLSFGLVTQQTGEIQESEGGLNFSPNPEVTCAGFLVTATLFIFPSTSGELELGGLELGAAAASLGLETIHEAENLKVGLAGEVAISAVSANELFMIG